MASVVLQFNVVEPFWETEVGVAEKDRVGAGGAATLTLTESFAVPPVPLQVSIKLLFAINELMVCDPDVALLPDQSPDAVQLVVLLVVQLNVVEPL